MKQIWTYFAGLALILPAGLAAENPAYDFIVKQAQDSLLSVRSVSTEYEAKAAARSAENYLPGPEVGFEYKWPQQRGNQNRWGIEVSQGFDWPGLYGARRKAAEEAWKTQKNMTAYAKEQVRYDVTVQLFELVDARKRLSLLRETGANLDSVYRMMQRMVNGGQTVILDLRKAEIELLTIREKIASAEANVGRIEREIGRGEFAVRGLEAITDYPAMILKPRDSYDYRNLVGKVTLDFMRAGSESNEKFHDAKIARMKKLPSFSLGYVHDFEEGVHFNGVSVGITLPDYGAGKNSKALALEKELAEMDAKELIKARIAEFDSDYDEAVRLSRILADYDAVMGGSDYLTLLRKSLNGGQITLANYLLEQNWFLNSQMDYLSLRLRYNLLLLSLEGRLE